MILFLKIIGLAILIMLGFGALYLFFQGATWVVNRPCFNTKPTPYNYKPEELWEPPTYWKNWEKNA